MEYHIPRSTLSFSFNAQKIACENCSGLGFLQEIDINLIYNPKLTIKKEGGIFPWSNRVSKDSWTTRILNEVARIHGFNLTTPIGNYPQKIFNLIFYGEGTKDYYKIEYTNRFGITNNHLTKYPKE